MCFIRPSVRLSVCLSPPYMAVISRTLKSMFLIQVCVSVMADYFRLTTSGIAIPGQSQRSKVGSGSLSSLAILRRVSSGSRDPDPGTISVCLSVGLVCLSVDLSVCLSVCRSVTGSAAISFVVLVSLWL